MEIRLTPIVRKCNTFSRNPLSQKTLDDLVYIIYNSRCGGIPANIDYGPY